ncbi:MAG: DUF1761 domain-containing protein [Bacteroidetes bacterium]|nr:MAG: DUF1761 domain-containing protein [Bacteroidota bacterium]
MGMGAFSRTSFHFTPTSMQKSSTINLWAVLVSALAYMGISAAWYGAFATPWMTLSGITEEQAQNAGPAPFIVGFIGAVLMFYVLAFFFAKLNIQGAVQGMLTAALIWLAFYFTQGLTNDLFSIRPWQLSLINTGSTLVTMLVAGAIIGAWKVKAKS